jgi:hypothetical protein
VTNPVQPRSVEPCPHYWALPPQPYIPVKERCSKCGKERLTKAAAQALSERPDDGRWLRAFVEISGDVVANIVARVRAPNNQTEEELAATADRLSRWVVDENRAALITEARALSATTESEKP